MRFSGFLFETSSCFLGTDQLFSAGIQHGQKLIMDKNSANCQNTAWTAEQMAALREDSIIYSSLSLVSEAIGSKRHCISSIKISIGRSNEAIEDSRVKESTETAL